MNARQLFSDGLTHASNNLVWENGWSTDSIEADSLVAHASDFGGTLRESHTVFSQATGATISATLGRLLLSLTDQTPSTLLTNRGSGPLKLVSQWLIVMVTTGATVGDPLFLSDAGIPSLTAGTIPKVIGWVDYVGAAGAGRGFVCPSAVESKWFKEAKILANSGANAPNSTDETAYDASITIPARHYFKGRRLTISGSIRFTATHTTDTATIRVKLGALTLFASAAVDVADNDTFQFTAEVVMRGAFSATAEVVGSYTYSFSTSGQVVTSGLVADASAVDNTGALAVTATCDWSAADAGNSSFLEMLNVRAELP